MQFWKFSDRRSILRKTSRGPYDRPQDAWDAWIDHFQPQVVAYILGINVTYVLSSDRTIHGYLLDIMCVCIHNTHIYTG